MSIVSTLQAASKAGNKMNSNHCLRGRLTEINAQIARLEAERKIIQGKLHSASTSPILRLPFEMTSEIFVHCFPDLREAQDIFKFGRQQLPTPLPLSQRNNHVQRSRQFASWVKRAGFAPLSFVINTRDPSLPAILDPIFALSVQWRDVDLRLPYRDLVTEYFQSNLHGKLPILEKLEIAMAVTDVRANGPAPPITAFELAPRLRRVSLEGLPPSLILFP
ncbi:hypothetical protein K438DRAFT_1978372 [Mycena galopus ATCC 62051]|nr:hypothetical protein K438DRAFT_1978372 [Mycena galopus ATCC 62051]